MPVQSILSETVITNGSDRGTVKTEARQRYTPGEKGWVSSPGRRAVQRVSHFIGQFWFLLTFG